MYSTHARQKHASYLSSRARHNSIRLAVMNNAQHVSILQPKAATPTKVLSKASASISKVIGSSCTAITASPTGRSSIGTMRPVCAAGASSSASMKAALRRQGNTQAAAPRGYRSSSDSGDSQRVEFPGPALHHHTACGRRCEQLQIVGVLYENRVRDSRQPFLALRNIVSLRSGNLAGSRHRAFEHKPTTSQA